MACLPYFPIYPKDIFVDDRMQLLRSEEQGLFILFLCKLWINENEIKDNDSKVSRMLRISEKKWSNLKTQLVESGLLEVDSQSGFITNRRLTDEFEFSMEKCEKAAKSAGRRWKHKKDNMKIETKSKSDEFIFEDEPFDF